MSAWIVSHGHIDAIVNFYSQQYSRAREGRGFVGFNQEPLVIKRYRRLPYSDGREADPYFGRVLVEDLKEHENRQRLGEILLNENWRSIWYRYPDTKKDLTKAPGTIAEIEGPDVMLQSKMDVADETKINIGGYTYKPCCGHSSLQFFCDCVSLGQFFKALNCLDYQSCEHPEWEDSDAKYIIDMMRVDALNDMILEKGLVKGWKDAEWCL